MSKVDITEIRVKELLEQYPDTRNNDNLLYVKYIEEYHYVEFNKNTFVHYDKYGLPSYKTIERNRRKIQNVQNYYKASQEVEAKRREAEQEYINNFMR